METKTNQTAEKANETKSKKGLGMTLTEAIGELEKGHKITCDASSNKDRYAYLDGKHIVNSETGARTNLEAFKAIAHKDKDVWRIYEPKLKNATQQKRVELIEKQKNELIAANATIDNQAATINDLLARNGNLTRIVNDQKERIEVLEHENKNYESAIKVLEVKETRINELYLAYEKRNQELEGLMSKATESRERLASKLTNWFLFLVTVIIIEAVFLVKMALENGSKP